MDLAARLANVDLNLLPPMLALLQERNVTAAANRIGVSQPAMSHALSRMRSVFGDDLLVRSGQRFVLTLRGAALLEIVQRILNDVAEQALKSPPFDPQVHTREFTIAMTPSTAYVIGPALMHVTAERAPGVSFQIVDTPEPGVDVFSRPEVDLALVADIVNVPHERKPLYQDRWVVVVARDNPLVHDEITLDHLSALTHIAYRSSIRTQPYIALAAAGVRPRYSLVSSNFLLIPMLVAGTRSLAIVQNRLARSLADRFELRVLELELDVPPLNIDVVRNPRLRGDTGVAWLTEELGRVLSPTIE